MKEYRFIKKLFGGEIQFVIYSEETESEIEKIIGEAYSEALRLQKIFNFFDKDGELSELNRLRKMKVSKELFSVLAMALRFSKITNGKYDVSLGEKIRARKSGLEFSGAEASYKSVEMNPKTREISLEDGTIIDLGSIAKGYIADKLGEFLKARGVGNFLIDARGDILVSGSAFHLVEVQHPREKNEGVLALKLKNQGVATSGDYMQYHESFEKSHILNQSEFVSVTVVAPTLELADVCATAIFVSDKKGAEILAEKFKEIKFMTIDRNLNAEFFNNMEEVIYDEH